MRPEPLLIETMHPVVRDYILWALATFPDETLEQQAIHLVKETRELCADSTPEEMADVAMLSLLIFFRTQKLAQRRGVNLQEAFAKKLAVNKKRTWIRSKDGDYNHER
jgi:hypothetical protein